MALNGTFFMYCKKSHFLQPVLLTDFHIVRPVRLSSCIRQQDSLDLCICCICAPAVQHVHVLHQLPVVVVVVVAVVGGGGAAGHQDPMDGGGGQDGAKDGAGHHVRGMVLVVRDAADGRKDGVQDTQHLGKDGNGKFNFLVFISKR